MSRDIYDRLATTYHAAHEQQRKGGSVSIHVGEAVFDDMKALAAYQMGEGAAKALSIDGSTAWGFPVYVEDWDDSDAIEVRTTVVIHS